MQSFAQNQDELQTRLIQILVNEKLIYSAGSGKMCPKGKHDSPISCLMQLISTPVLRPTGLSATYIILFSIWSQERAYGQGKVI